MGRIRKLDSNRWLVYDDSDNVIGRTSRKHRAETMLRRGIELFTDKKCSITLPNGSVIHVKKITRKDNDLVIIP